MTEIRDCLPQEARKHFINLRFLSARQAQSMAGLGCRGQEFLYFCLHAFQDAHIDGSLDLFAKFFCEFSDVLRYAFYVYSFSYSRRSIL